MVNGVIRKVPRPNTRGVGGFESLWPRDLPRKSIHHDSPKVFTHNVILLSSQTSKMGFLSANGLSREYHGQYTGHEALHIGRVKSHYTREGCRKNYHWSVTAG